MLALIGIIAHFTFGLTLLWFGLNMVLGDYFKKTVRLIKTNRQFKIALHLTIICFAISLTPLQWRNKFIDYSTELFVICASLVDIAGTIAIFVLLKKLKNTKIS